MFRWTPYPLIRIALFLCSGILIGIYNPRIARSDAVLVITLLISGITLVSYLLRKNGDVFKYSLGFCCLAVLSFSGILLVRVRTDINNHDHFIHIRDSILCYEGVIEGHLEEKVNSFRTTISIQQVKSNNGWQPAVGKVNFYFSKTGFNNELNWGDHIIVTGSPKETSAPLNPHEFNYKRFLTFNNIYHQQYVRQGEWIKTDVHDQSFTRWSSIVRTYFTNTLKRYVSGSREQAVVLALIIGVKDGIDNDLVNAYSASGAMHVLAVSGLHVGIIYWILLLILKPLQKNEKGKWLVSIICLIMLWSYAFVTGLSPSVLRAVMMFSFVAVSKAINQRSSIYNTLAGSAFILLLVDPYLIMSVGFQLSYLAVIGIIWVQRPLYQLYEPTNKVINWVWSISCVSIAAQATTFSLGLLYFHQFPAYFLLSNLIVIPAATVVLILGIIVLVLSVLDPLATIAGWILERVSWILNWSVFTVEDLPYSIVSNIYLNVAQSWMILGILVTFIFVFQFKQIKWLYFSGALAVLFSLSRWDHFSGRQNNAQLAVYSIAGSTAVEIIKDGQSTFIADSVLMNDRDKIRFHISGNRLFNLVQDVKSIRIKKSQDSLRLIHHNNLSLFFVDQPIHLLGTIEKPDYVIVSRGGLWSVPTLEDQFPNSTIIMDGTCNSFLLNNIKPKLKRPEKLFSVIEQGAFIRNL